MESCNNFVSVVTASDWTINGPSLLDEHMYGSDAFFSLDILVDDKNSSRYITKVGTIVMNDTSLTCHIFLLQLSQSGLSMDSDLYSTKNKVQIN